MIERTLPILATRKATAVRVDAFRAVPLTIEITIPDEIGSLAGASILRAEIRSSRVDLSATALAGTSISLPIGKSFDLTFTSAQMNQSLSGEEYKEFWLVVYATYPPGAVSGSTDLELDVFASIDLVLHEHAASLTAPSPPNAAIALTKTQADLLYMPIGGGTPGTGTVTSVAVNTANGVSAVVTNPSSNAAMTFTLGAITPSSVTATGAVSGSSLSTTGNVSGTWAGTAISLAKGGTGATTASGARTALELGTMATQDTGSYLASDWAGSANIATVGTVTTGTWSASTIALAKGGTGATTAVGARTALELGSLAQLSAAPAGTLTGATLAANVTASSLTSLGTLSALTVTAPISGSVTGSAANFTGALTGDVTGTQSATAIAATTVTGKALTGFSSSAGTVTAADTILTAIGKLSAATGAATVSPIQTLLDGVGALEIIPVMRHFGVVGGEKLGLWYSTDELKTFADLYPGDLYTAPSGGVRDPSLLIRADAWYVAYTAGLFGANVNYWGLAKSTNKGATWSFLQNTVVAASVPAGAGNGAYTWGPSWFIDPATGKTHMLLSISPIGQGGAHRPYLQTATSADLLTWDSGVPLTGTAFAAGASIWDNRITYAGGFYYLVTAYNISATYNLRIYRATAVAGPYTLYKEPAPFTGLTTGIEQCQLTYLGAGRWRINYTMPEAYDLYVAESWDNLETWQTPVRVLDFTGVNHADGTAHNFSETVKIRSRITDPLPVNPGAITSLDASALTGTTLAAGVTASSLTSLGTLTALTVSGQSRAFGATPGTSSGTTSTIGIYTGQLAGTPRVIWANGVLDQNYSADNNAGTLRWISLDVARMTLSPTGLLTPSSFATTGNSNWGIGATFAYGDSTASAAHRTALGLGTLATVSPTGTANATTYLRGDGSWATITSSGGFIGTANRIIVGGATTNADGSIENTLATTGVSATVNNAILAVPAAVGTANVNLVLSPKGTGAIIGFAAPDGGTGGGNARGVGATDFQRSRDSASAVASGLDSFIAGGYRNTVTGQRAFASGEWNTISGFEGCFGFGFANSASGYSSGAAGANNVVAPGGGESCFAFGKSNIISGSLTGGFVIGRQCTVSTSHAFATGQQSKSDRLAQFSHASGLFSAVGDAQRANFVLRCSTSLSPSTVEMALDGGSTYLTIPSGKTMAFIAHIAGTKVGGTLAGDVDACYFIRKGIIRNQNSTISIVGAVVEETVYAGTGGTNTCVVDAFETTADYLRIRVATPWTSSQTWRWVANVEAVEIGHV